MIGHDVRTEAVAAQLRKHRPEALMAARYGHCPASPRIPVTKRLRLDRYMMAAVRSEQEQFASVLGSKLKGETLLGRPRWTKLCCLL